MAKATQVKIHVKGVDGASAMFRRIGSTAKSVAVGFAAISAAGVAASAAVVKTWSSMTKINDLAQKAGTSASDLQKMATAFNQLGIQGANIEGLSQALTVMTKTTGKTGLKGFVDVIEEIKTLDRADGMKRLQEVFGRSGLNFAPLLAGDTDALREFIGVQSAMGDGAISAATKAYNAWALFKTEFSNIFGELAGEFAKWLDDNIDGGLYGAVYRAIAYVRYGVKAVISELKMVGAAVEGVLGAIYAPFEFLGKLLGGSAAAVMDLIEGNGQAGNTLENAFRDATYNNKGFEMMAGAGADFSDAIDEMVKGFDDLKKELSEANKKAAEYEDRKNRASKPGLFGDGNGDTSKASLGSSRNDLILGGSYASLSASSRRDNDQRKIAANTGDILDQLKIMNGNLDFAGV